MNQTNDSLQWTVTSEDVWTEGCIVGHTVTYYPPWWDVFPMLCFVLFIIFVCLCACLLSASSKRIQSLKGKILMSGFLPHFQGSLQDLVHRSYSKCVSLNHHSAENQHGVCSDSFCFIIGETEAQQIKWWASVRTYSTAFGGCGQLLKPSTRVR